MPSTQSRVSSKVGPPRDPDPDLDAALSGDLRMADDAEVLERRPIQPSQDQELLPRRLRPGIDVDERVGGPIGRVDRARPRVQLHRGLLGKPRERRRRIDDGVLLRPLLAMVVRPALDPRRGVAREVLLPEALLLDPVGEALHGEPVVVEIRHEGRGDLDVVAEQVALRHRRLALARREQDLLEVRDPDLVAVDDPDPLLLDRLEGGDRVGRIRAGPGRWLRIRRLCALGLRGRAGGRDLPLASHASRVLLRLDPLVRRLAQQVVGSPLGEFDADDDLRLDPVGAAEPRCRVERRIGTLDLAHPGEELAAGSRAEAAADLAGVSPPVPRANAEDQRAEVGVASPAPAASRRRPPPARAGPSASATTCCAGRARTASAGASRRSPRAPARGPRRRTPRRHPPRGSRSGRGDAVAGGPSAGACAPRAARRRSDLPVEVEQVEDLVDDRRRLALPCRFPARARSGCPFGPGGG